MGKLYQKKYTKQLFKKGKKMQSQLEVMQAVKDGKLTVEEANELLNTTKKDLKARMRVKVSLKGAVQIDGFRTKWPVTLYRRELEAILDSADMLREFIKNNSDKLSVKGEN